MNQNTKPRNPLVTRRNGEERRKGMLDRLLQPNIQNVSPNYNMPVQAVQSPAQRQLVVVTLDKLRPYEGNPRRTKNPAFEEIKASIKARGLDHAPNVTQRPGDDFYTIADGGNTRLQALTELFQETQDSRFWSIECVFKPWQGDDIDSELNMIIGHLAENDIRGELSFIEKALGIQRVKSLYEEQLQETLSHRKLSDKLTDNGYPISHQIIARMELCLTYLYPHIPNILLNGLGKAQIEKLLSIYRNASASWDKYSLEIEPLQGFDEVWMHTLSPFDEDVENFAITDLQDTLIGNISEALHYQVSYDALKLEIDLEERKLQKLIERQAEITQRAAESEQHLQHLQQQAEDKANVQSKKAVAAEQQSIINNQEITDPRSLPIEAENIDSDDPIPEEEATGTALDTPPQDTDINEILANHLAGFGFASETTRQDEAIANGLEFANNGRQPITNLWKIYPNRKHKMDAYSIALDIAEECGLDHLVQHVVYEPVDYSFTLLPLDIEHPSPLVTTVYTLLSALRTDKLGTESVDVPLSLSSELLLGSLSHPAEISDVMLVRLFRLIRIIRHLKEQYRQGEQNA